MGTGGLHCFTFSKGYGGKVAVVAGVYPFKHEHKNEAERFGGLPLPGPGLSSHNPHIHQNPNRAAPGFPVVTLGKRNFAWFLIKHHCWNVLSIF